MGVLFVNTKSDKYEAIVKLIKIGTLNGNSEDGENKKTTKAELLANSEPMVGYFAKEPIILPRVDLPDKYYIYSTGPYRSTDPFREKELLAFWYFRCLELAHESKCRTVLIPLISADTYSYDTAIQIAYDTCNYYLRQNWAFMDVFILAPERSVRTDRERNQDRWFIRYKQREFAEISSYIDQHYCYDPLEQGPSELDSPEGEHFPVPQVIDKDYYHQKKQLAEYLSGKGIAPVGKSDSDKKKESLEPDLTEDDSLVPVSKPLPVSQESEEEELFQVKEITDATDEDKAEPDTQSEMDKTQSDSQMMCLYQRSFESPQTKKEEEKKETYVEIYFQTGPARPDLPDKENIMIEETFREMLLRLMNEKDMSAPEVYTKACMDRKLFSKILSSDDYQPRKYTVVRLALALDLSLDETNEFMNNAGFALSHGKLKDLVIEYCIEHHMKSVNSVNDILKEWGLTTI